MDANSRIAAVAAPAALSAGLELDSVEVIKQGSRTTVVITIDLPEDQIGSASMDSVADASRAISAALDEADVVKGAYTLEVGTPGLSRALTERKHFMRARTRLVSLQLLDGTVVEGRLLDVANDVLVLDQAGAGLEVALGEVEGGRIEVEFKRLDDDNAELDGDSADDEEGA